MITFRILHLEYITPSNGVVSVHWQGTKTTADAFAVLNGVLSLVPNPSDPSFVPYGSLTESIVISWVTSSFSTEELAKLETTLDAQLLMKNPQRLIGLPWIV